MKVGRNDLCPCGSGKKYKKCCMYRGVVPFTATNTKFQPLQATRDLSDINEDSDDSNTTLFRARAMNNFHAFLLRNLPHIKEYKKIRRLHGEIVDSMMQYYLSGKFELEVVKINNFPLPISKFLTKKLDPLKVICILSGMTRVARDRGSAGKLVRLTRLTV